MKVKDLAKFKQNPRKISAQQQRILAKTIEKWGDLSGVVWNVQIKELVGGNQRSDVFDPNDEIIYTEKFDKPDEQGTVALGYIMHNKKKYAYREVKWTRKEHMAACLAANKGGGEWDWAGVKEIQLDLDDGMFDMEETGFGLDEIEELLVGGEFDEPDEKSDPTLKEAQLKTCPNCGVIIENG